MMYQDRGVDRLERGIGESLILIVAEADGRISDVNDAACSFVGRSREAICSEGLASQTDQESLAVLLRQFNGPVGRSSNAAVRFNLKRGNGTLVPIAAICEIVTTSTGNRQLRILALHDAKALRHLRDLESTVALLTDFIELSSEAMWCMEYTELVDLSASPQEIIRQIFENECHWRMCNHAMARLYNLPEGLDFNRQLISAYFRRNPENEAFVRQLIEAKFHIDAAPSLDVRHDGSFAYIENTVRCHIEGNWMHRLWGTVRDVTEFRTTENKLTQRQRAVTDILKALPDPILVVDMSRRAVALNPAFESTFGWLASAVLGNDVSNIVNLEARRPGERRWFAEEGRRWATEVRGGDGTMHQCDVRIARMSDDSDRRFVLAIRPTNISLHRAQRVRKELASKSPMRPKRRT